MKIGNIDLGNRPIMLAPMEDVTDPSFRLICKEQGADMVYTEFVSADALIRNINSTTRKLFIDPAERPAAIQIYGKEVEPMVEAAKIAEAAQPDVLDINFGCPVKKVASKGAGSGMLRNVPLLLEITRAIVDAVKIPVTVKTRLGWDCENKIIVELAEQLQDCGIKALTIHGRTRSQIYMATGEHLAIRAAEKMALLRRQISESIDRIDEYRGILHIRRHLAASPLFKGIPNFRSTRIAMLQAGTRAELEAILDHVEATMLA